MNGFSVELTGLQAVMERLSSFGRNVMQGVDDEMDAAAENIAGNAREDCPVGDGKGGSGLRQSISVNRDGPLQKSVVANKFYAPYVEFGTGDYAAEYVQTLPEEIQAYAMTFYVNGKGHMPAAPFMFPNVVKEQPLLIERIKQVIKDA